MFTSTLFNVLVRHLTKGRLFRRNYFETHYDTLNLSRNCSSSDIKNAFIKLSKKYHPDVNNSKESQARFVKILQAYNVLSKSDTRREYDLGLPNADRLQNRNYGYGPVYREVPIRNPWEDDSFWINRNLRRDPFYKEKPYYGVKGIQKVSNAVIVFLCLGFASFGLLLQMYAIRSSFTLNRDEMNRRSVENSRILETIKEEASANEETAQIQLVKDRLTNDAKRFHLVPNDDL